MVVDLPINNFNVRTVRKGSEKTELNLTGK